MTDAVDEYCMEALTEYEGTSWEREGGREGGGERERERERVDIHSCILKVRSSTMLLKKDSHLLMKENLTKNSLRS